VQKKTTVLEAPWDNDHLREPLTVNRRTPRRKNHASRINRADKQETDRILDEHDVRLLSLESY
jgi:hypothetical protein